MKLRFVFPLVPLLGVSLANAQLVVNGNYFDKVETNLAGSLVNISPSSSTSPTALTVKQMGAAEVYGKVTGGLGSVAMTTHMDLAAAPIATLLSAPTISWKYNLGASNNEANYPFDAFLDVAYTLYEVDDSNFNSMWDPGETRVSVSTGAFATGQVLSPNSSSFSGTQFLDPALYGAGSTVSLLQIGKVYHLESTTTLSIDAQDISSFSTMVQTATYLSNNANEGVTWEYATTPVPEPATMCVLGLGCLPLLRRFGRRRLRG